MTRELEQVIRAAMLSAARRHEAPDPSVLLEALELLTEALDRWALAEGRKRDKRPVPAAG